MRRRRFIAGAATLALSPVAATALDATATALDATSTALDATSRTSRPSGGTSPRATTADAVGWLGHAPPRHRTPLRAHRRDPEPETP